MSALANRTIGTLGTPSLLPTMRELNHYLVRLNRSDMVNKRPKILVVDDYEVLRLIVAEILENAGFDVTTACDGFEGVAMATANHFDVIFMDVTMPGIDGVEAFRRIKEVSPESIVIMMTGFKGRHLQQALDEGELAVIYKPFHTDRLINLVRTILSDENHDESQSSSVDLPSDADPLTFERIRFICD